FSPRLGFGLREDLTLQLRYSLYQQDISLPSTYNNCNNRGGLNTPAALNAAGSFDPANSATWGCYADGESSLPVRRELAGGATITSLVGYTLNYNTLDNNKNPTDGLFVEWKQDYAGVGGDVSYLKSTIDAKYYTPLVADIVGLLRVQGGKLNSVGKDLRMLDNFQMGPNLVRGFAPNGIGPRDISYVALGSTGDALGGTKYWGASAELQMPFWFLPKEVGIKGAVYADAGGLWDYQGPTSWAQTGEVNTAGCVPASKTTVGTCTGLQYDSGNVVRSSVGVGLIWQSPFGPLRFDYAVPITKGEYDRVQQFKFGGGTSF
ncbi:MAG: surface antigen, partial [Tardiphaga sp.]|nr:surface antigen [Tardiphaga sp.]